MFKFIKHFLSNDTFFYSGIVLLVGVGSFGLGRLSVSSMATIPQTASVQLVTPKVPTVIQEVSTVDDGEELYVASKNGTKYHLLTCPGAKQIAEQNKLFFRTVADATAAGYVPAANCPGL